MGASVLIEGVLVGSQGPKQKVELKAMELALVNGFIFLSCTSHPLLSCFIGFI